MEWFADNWPILLIGIGLFIIVSGLIRRMAKLAFIGVTVGVVGLVIWPMVSGSI